MTYTFTPEAASLATVPPGVTAYLAVKGERRAGACTTNDQWFPPADLAALAEQRCETCRSEDPGHEWKLGYNRSNCPDCHDGKPMHTIQYECHANHLIDSHEPPCDESGLITLPGRWTYDALLLVVSNMQGREPDRPCVEVWSPSYTREWYLHPKWGTYLHRQITVDGAPEPGHFVLAATRRTP